MAGSAICCALEHSEYGGEIGWDASKPSGTPRKLLDAGKLNRLGWRPTGLEEGIQLIYKDFLHNSMRAGR